MIAREGISGKPLSSVGRSIVTVSQVTWWRGVRSVRPDTHDVLHCMISRWTTEGDNRVLAT